MKRFLTIILFVVAAAFVLGLVACGTEDEEWPDIVFVRPTPRPDPMADYMLGKTIITYATGRDTADAARQLVDAFNAQSDDVFVQLALLHRDVTQRYYEMSLDWRTEDFRYDVTDISLEWAANFAAEGYILCLNSFVQRDGLNLNVFFANSVDALMYDGSLWALPGHLYANLLYFRSDVVSRPPNDWQEMLDFAALNAGLRGTRHGLVLNGRDNENQMGQFIQLMYAYGGGLLENGRAAVNSPAGIRAAEIMRDMITGTFTPGFVSHHSYIDAAAAFAAGDSVYFIGPTSVWRTINARDSAVRTNFAAAKLPYGPGGSFSVLGGTAFAINAVSENADAAWEFIRFAISVEGQRILAVHGNLLPARSALITDRDVITANPHFTDENFMPIMQSAALRPVTPFYTQISAIVLYELQLLFDGEQTAAEAVEVMETRINELLG